MNIWQTFNHQTKKGATLIISKGFSVDNISESRETAAQLNKQKL